MEPNNFFGSSSFKTALWVIFIIVIALLIFVVGMFVGYKKADFSCGWGENYHRNFAGPQNGFGKGLMMGGELIDGHGTFGQVLKIEDGSIVVNGKNDVEKIILINKDTSIKRFRDDIKISDLRVNDPVVIIGEPNSSGQIEAKLVRVMPPMPRGGQMMPGEKIMRADFGPSGDAKFIIHDASTSSSTSN